MAVARASPARRTSIDPGQSGVVQRNGPRRRPQVRRPPRNASQRRGGVVAGRGHRPGAARGPTCTDARARTRRIPARSVVGVDGVAEYRPVPGSDRAACGSGSRRRCRRRRARQPGPADADLLRRLDRRRGAAQCRCRSDVGGRFERGIAGIPAGSLSLDRRRDAAGLADSVGFSPAGGFGDDHPTAWSRCVGRCAGAAAARRGGHVQRKRTRNSRGCSRRGPVRRCRPPDCMPSKPRSPAH